MHGREKADRGVYVLLPHLRIGIERPVAWFHPVANHDPIATRVDAGGHRASASLPKARYFTSGCGIQIVS